VWETQEVSDNDPMPAVDLAVERLSAGWAGVRDRLERFETWRRDLTRELVELPESLRKIRHGAANFELVGERLADSSESLEEITQLYRSTISETTRRSAEAADALKTQIDQLVGQSPERVTSTLVEMQRTFDSLADLNPFWPRRARPPDDGDP
jgi:hypothetical protein